MNKKYPFVSSFLFLIVGIVIAQSGLSPYWLFPIIGIYGFFLPGKWWMNYGVLIVLILPAWVGSHWMLQAKQDAIKIESTLKSSQAVLVKVLHVDVLNFRSNTHNINLKAQIVGHVSSNELQWLPETEILIKSPNEDFAKWENVKNNVDFQRVGCRKLGEVYLIEGWKYASFKNEVLSEFRIQTFKTSQWIQLTNAAACKLNEAQVGEWFCRYWNFLRRYIENSVLKKIQPNLSEQGWNMFLKLMLGQKGALDKQEMKYFQKAGIVHVLSVSGMHVALVFSVLFWPLKWIRWKWLNAIAWMLVLFVIWMYGAITGMSPPVERAVWAISYSQIGQFIFKRKIWIPDAFFVVGCLQLSMDPLVLFDLGFQLSYAAMLGIALVVPIFNEWMVKYEWPKWKEYFVSGIVISIICSLTTLPLILYYFKQFSTWFLIGNLLLIPVFTMLIYSYLIFVLLAFLGMFDWLKEIRVFTISVFDGFILGIRKLLEFIDHLPYGYVYSPNFGLSTALALCLLILCWIHQLHFPDERKWTIWAIFPFLFLVSL